MFVAEIPNAQFAVYLTYRNKSGSCLSVVLLLLIYALREVVEVNAFERLDEHETQVALLWATKLPQYDIILQYAMRRTVFYYSRNSPVYVIAETVIYNTLAHETLSTAGEELAGKTLRDGNLLLVDEETVTALYQWQAKYTKIGAIRFERTTGDSIDPHIVFVLKRNKRSRLYIGILLVNDIL